MWRAYNEFNFSAEEWVENLNDIYKGAHYMYVMNRILRRAARDKVITREEQKSLWNMIKASDEDCYTALSALEGKYKLKE